MITRECTNQEEWDDFVLSHGGHPLQLWGWGEVKQRHGWRAQRIFVERNDDTIGAAQILIRKLPWPFSSLSYIPRGPVTEKGSREAVLQELVTYAKRISKSVALTIEPEWEESPPKKPWKKAKTTILIPRTIMLDLSRSEDELLAGMAKKTRQYIRKSQHESLTFLHVKTNQELKECLSIYKQTAARAHFALHGDQYYYDIYEKLGEHSPVFAAFSDGKPVAFVWLAVSEATAFELYGGMNEEGQRTRANYALKWHAIQTMKQWGVQKYDMNGLLNDGVSGFKRGFTDEDTNLIGTYDAPLSPLYTLWNHGLPLAKKAVQTAKKRVKR